MKRIEVIEVAAGVYHGEVQAQSTGERKITGYGRLTLSNSLIATMSLMLHVGRATLEVSDCLKCYVGMCVVGTEWS